LTAEKRGLQVARFRKATGKAGAAATEALPPAIADAAGLRRRLLRWYARAKRDLPWRRTRDPYAVWVSEVMLQQTQVERVKEFFTRFMRRFPAVGNLAAAREAEVLKHWEGLGYYRRARQLHAAAKAVVMEHGGDFPRSHSICPRRSSRPTRGGCLPDLRVTTVPWAVRETSRSGNSRRQPCLGAEPASSIRR
jgi:hypothetical protein